jgi:predicted enzyme related to lactoylglutathione lyase
MAKLKNPIGWFEIHVEDMARTSQFYETVFSQTLVDMPSPEPDMQMRMLSGNMTMHGANGALVKHPMRKPSTQGVMVYFSCADCATQQALARENGGQVFKSKFKIGDNGFIAIIGDSEGNAIELHLFA